MKKKGTKADRKERTVPPANSQSIPAASVPQKAAASLSKPASSSSGISFSHLWVWCFPILLFFAMTVQTKTMSIVLAALTLILSIGATPLRNLKARLSIPVIGLLSFLILCLAGSLYSNFGSYAGQEYAKFAASGALALLLLARGEKKDVRGLLWGFGAVCAVIAVLCVDFSCQGPLFSGFSRFMSLLGTDAYQDLTQATYTGARFNGIYNDANLTGSLLGLGMLICLYLAHTAGTKLQALLADFLLGLCAVSFLVAMSRGAMLCFGVALICYLIAAHRGNRLSLFFHMFFTGLSTACFGILAIFLLSRGSVFGTLVMLPCGLVIWLLNTLLGKPLSSAVAGHGKVAGALLACLVLVAAAGSAIALTQTKPFVFIGTNYLYRSVPVQGGATYTMTGDWDTDAEITMRVYGSNDTQALLNQTETYYNGPLSQASFTVPDGVNQVFIRFDAPSGTELRSVALSDGTEIPMAYTFLPENIVSRFQGNLLKNSSFLLRRQYDIDGLQLFLRSPIWGHGLGATEGLLTSVQPFYYESLYVHNHLLQVMDETGLLGLAAFLALLIGPIWLLVRRLRRSADPLAAALLACCAMMNLHSLMEISFSIRMFQCAAFYLLMVIVLEYFPQPNTTTQKGTGLSWCVPVISWLWLGISCLLILGNLAASNLFQSLPSKEMTQEQFISEMKRLDWMDCYSDTDYKTNLMANSLQAGDLSTAARCATDLVKTGEFDACYQAAAYYYLPLGQISEFFQTVQLGLDQERSNSDAWNSAFHLYVQAFQQLSQEDALTFVDGVMETGQRMEQANEFLIADITLSEEAQSLLSIVNSIHNAQMDASQAYMALSLLLSSMNTETSGS